MTSYVNRTLDGQLWRIQCSNELEKLFIERADEETLREILHDGKNHLVI